MILASLRSGKKRAKSDQVHWKGSGWPRERGSRDVGTVGATSHSDSQVVNSPGGDLGRSGGGGGEEDPNVTHGTREQRAGRTTTRGEHTTHRFFRRTAPRDGRIAAGGERGSASERRLRGEAILPETDRRKRLIVSLSVLCSEKSVQKIAVSLFSMKPKI
ncbi:Hypothetical predicted protein [Cloeon dipterum]|uniref:Uncharacterized protein n=1 Tax=Cloeon dipterum TaxID=197152 RepID=A0A8S1DMQ9_9INSE|nr:Hypothetical predicted protein [Cloeon dipterum]